MNEIIFFLQVAAIGLFVKGAQKLGKEALMALAVLLAIFANFFVLKQIPLFGWTVTCSDAYVIGHLMCLNLLQQIGSKETAQKTIALSFAAMLIFALVSQIHVLFYPSSFDQNHVHYQALLAITPRLLAASLTTFYLVQQLDLFLFRKFLKMLPSFSWQARSIISLFISQGFDTLLFTFLGLYGAVEDWVAIFWMSFAVKCSAILAMSILWSKPKGQIHEI